MKHFSAPAFGLAVLLSGCATTPPAPTESTLAGVWGEDEADCRANPHTITFSPQGDLMHVRYAEGGTADNESLQERFTYRVLAHRAYGLHLALQGETRLDDSGSPVTWEARQAELDSYCWWRSDWPATSCTAPRVRCEL